jgi:hypothetical protein
MSKPVCVACQRFFRPKKNGYALTEMMPIGPDRPLPGTQEPHRWKPYKVWLADMWECEGCHVQIVVGFARQPISEHYKPDFKQTQVAFHATQLLVNDC